MNENQQEMYQYLLDHAYVSKIKKNPFRQKEMTRQRAKCIACKCGNMIDEKTKELQERIDKAINYIKEKQKIQYKYTFSQIECEEILGILSEGSDK